jgi:predicted HicB family RNase H-like nuclease
MSRSRQINFRCPEDVARVFEQAAAKSKVSLAQWLISTGLTAAGHTELLEQLQRVAPKKKRATRR